MNKLTRRLNFQQAAEILGVAPDEVRSLVVEERRIPAVYITQVAHSAEPFSYQLLKVDSEGRAFDMAVGGMEGTVHTGFLRIERVALEKFICDEGLVISKMWTPTNLAEESGRAQPLECRPLASSTSPAMVESASAAPVATESPEQRRARWLEWYGKGERGAVQRVFERELLTNPKADRSFIGKEIKKAGQEKQQSRTSGNMVSQLVQSGKR